MACLRAAAFLFCFVPFSFQLRLSLVSCSFFSTITKYSYVSRLSIVPIKLFSNTQSRAYDFDVWRKSARLTGTTWQAALE
jgi:hypothetical protein